MLVLSSLITLEKNKLSSMGAWLLLATITLPDLTVLRFVRNNENVTYQGNVYTAIDFALEAIEQDLKGKLPSVSLRIGNVGRVLQSYIEAQNGIGDSIVLLQAVNSSLLAEDFSLLDLTFEIQKTSVDSKYVTFELGVPSPLNKRFPLYRYSGAICNWASRFKEAECKYIGAETVCDGQLVTCQTRIAGDNTLNYGGFPGLGTGGVGFAG